MRDPIEELSSFDPGGSVHPLPAAEVRRRGERLRRRNLALVAGAVAAVLVVAIPISVLAGGDEGGRPEPAGLTTDALLTADEVPARERLTEWRAAQPEGEVLACAPQENSLADDAEVSVRRDFGADEAGTPAAGDYAVSVVKTSVLQFADEATARDAYDRAQGWILDCPGSDDLALKDVSMTEVDIEGGRGEWRRHDLYARDVCIECDAIRFNRMGVAQFDDRVVLVSLAELGSPVVPEGLDETMDELIRAAVRKAGGEVVGGTSGGLDFPIETGLPAADGQEITMEGPGPDVEGVVLPEGFCGASSWPPAAAVARLAVRVTGPEYAQTRELVTFETEDQAAAAVADVRAAVESCPELPGDVPANDQMFVAQPVDSGYDDATFSSTYREGTGGGIYQFVRVGHAVLATVWGGEWTPETAPRGAQELNGQNQQLTALMCEYADTGC